MDDHKLTSEERASISEFNRKIGLIKHNQAPDVFKIERHRILNRAESARVEKRPTPEWLEEAMELGKE
jgi:hypothetical protein